MSEDPEHKEFLEKHEKFLKGESQFTAYLQLEKRGHAPPQPEGLSDEEINHALTELVWGLEDLGVYISHTDHLPDRELYTKLLDYCDEPQAYFPGKNKRAMLGWSATDSGSDEDDDAYLRYYATEKTRKQWARDFKIKLPPRETPQYTRPWIPEWNPEIPE